MTFPRAVHFVGIGGIGVSALARLLLARGVVLSGSDVELPPVSTLPPGEFWAGSDPARIPEGVELLVYSPAVPDTDPERVEGKRRQVRALSYPEALGEFSRPFVTIAVSGTHGKSTTTAFLGKLFESGGLDPSVIVGAEVPGWNRNFREGKSDVLIVEACEYRRHMLNLAPQTILLTNLELDHPDYYRDLDDVKDAFRAYIQKLGPSDLLIRNDDDANLRDVCSSFSGRTVTFGFSDDADLSVRKLSVRAGGGQQGTLVWGGTLEIPFTTPLPGRYNISNILGATATYLAHEGDPACVAETIRSFHGIGRRFEVVGTCRGAEVITDYAHHPTALRAVLSAASERYARERTLVVLRPHHRDRVRVLFHEYVEAILEAPHMILLPVYDAAGREAAGAIGSEELAQKVIDRNPAGDFVYVDDMSMAEHRIRERADDFDAIVIVGAGDADRLARALVVTGKDE
jgi:UDP-N-acetylmuramate--alanine ligase